MCPPGEHDPESGAPRQPRAPSQPRQRLPRSARIRRGEEIRTFVRTGRRVRGRWLEAFALPAVAPRPRFGTVVPKHGRRIVDRNLLRRRLREIGRTMVLPRMHEQDPPLDVLVRSRPGAYDAGFPDLVDELTRLTERLCSENWPSD